MRMMSNTFWRNFFIFFNLLFLSTKHTKSNNFMINELKEYCCYINYELSHKWNFHNCPYQTSSRIIDRYVSCKCWLSFKSPSIYQSTQITFLANLRYFYPSWKHAFAIIYNVFSYQGIANDDGKERKKGTVFFLYNTYIYLGPAKKEIVDCCMENVENTSQCPEYTHDRWRKLPPTFSTFLSSITFIAENSTLVDGWQLYKWMGEWIEKEIYFWKMPSASVDVFHFPSFLFPSHLLTVFFNFFLLLYCCSWCRRRRYYPFFLLQ